MLVARLQAEFAGGDDMSDIQYLAIKEFNSKLRQNDSTRTTAGVLATLQATGGKDMYIAKAYCNIRTTNVVSSSANLGIVILKINGTEVERFSNTNKSSAGGGESGAEAFSHDFINIGFKVAATQFIELEVLTATNVTISGDLVCFEEDTGTSPQIPPLNPV